jgi:Arc/MetJ-type ribon-helix-helix transcriptional regulator
MKLSVSLSEKEVEFIDLYVTEHDLESRSAALQVALRTLRDLGLADSYAEAFSEKEEPEWTEHWDKQWVETGGGKFPQVNAPR